MGLELSPEVEAAIPVAIRHVKDIAEFTNN